jgi:hypothetical protein
MATAAARRDPVGDEWLDIEGASRLRLRFKRAWLDQWLEQFALQNDPQ